jgi:uncharacterized protein YndB with AHSA1/START domain
MIDVKEHVSAVRREVGTRTLEAGEARVVTLSRTYDAPLDDVFDACTNIERIPRWFTGITGDLRPGGRYQIKENASGTVERCDPPRSFAATWEFGGNTSWIEARFTPVPEGGTTMTLEHVAHVDDEFWERYGPGATGLGWELGFLGLAGHLGAPGIPKAEEGEAWAVSAEGREYIALSGQAWGDAHIAAGDDPGAARASAARTVAFYTGTESPDGSGEPGA